MIESLTNSVDFWRKRYHELAQYILPPAKPHTGRPKEDHEERNQLWLKQADEFTERRGMRLRKACEKIADGPEGREANVTADYIRNVVIKLRKARRADAATSTRR